MQIVLAACLGDKLSPPFGVLLGDLVGERLEDVIEGDSRVPGFEVGHVGKRCHGLPIGRRCLHCVATLLLVEPAVASGDHETGSQTLDVPLPRAGERLIEVVDVEDQVTLRRPVHAEVGQMGVAADLGSNAGVGRGGKVTRHDLRRPPVEGEWRL